MSVVLGFFQSALDLLPRITVTGLIEIAIIAWMIYEFLYWIKDTRAWTLLRGIVIIFVFFIICILFRLNTILWIMERLATIAVLAILIVFQPELRRALERLGSGRFLADFRLISDKMTQNGISEHTISEIVKASFELGRAKTGALMVIEQSISLDDIIRTGIDIDGRVSSQLLINIFEHNTPLHDGAVVIRNNTIVSATCYLTLSENMKISKDFGTRHRAALGVSETTDSLTVVVSEETGNVSVARDGELKKIESREELTEILKGLSSEPAAEKGFRLPLFGWRRKDGDERKASE